MHTQREDNKIKNKEWRVSVPYMLHYSGLTDSHRGSSVCVCCRRDVQSTQSDAEQAIQATTGG